MAINPKGNDLKRFLAEEPGAPVVMLNLLRFKDGGRPGYEDYARRFTRYAARVGAEVLYAGLGSTVLVAEPGQAWDAVLVVRYRTRKAFSQMVGDPEYQAFTHLRTEALAEAVLQATTPWTFEVP